MRLFEPDNISEVAYMPAQYGWLLQEPIVLTSLASEMHDEAGTSVDGRYQKHLGETHATSVLKRQDTYLSGTAGRSGFAFMAVQGAWKDDYVHPTYHTYCLGVGDGSPSTSNSAVYEVVSVSAPDTDMEHAEMWLEWSDPPVSTDGTDYSHDRGKRYTYVHLAYQSPDRQDYRIAFEYGQPIRLDVSYDAGATWLLGVAVLKDCGNFERFLEANGKQIRLRITPSLGYQILGVEVGDGHMLTHQPDKTLISPPKNITPYQDSDHLLPRNGKIRVLHRNSTLKFAYFPSRFQDLAITKSAINLGDKVKDSSGAFLTVNSLGSQSAAQTTTGQVNATGGKLSWNARGTLPDAGDGLGSKQPAAFNDVSIVVPAKWGAAPEGTPPDVGRQIARLDSYWVEEIQDWNDTTRTLTTSATLRVENGDGRWDGLFGDLALNIQATNGDGTFYQRLQGVVDAKRNGITFDRRDPVREMILRATDKSLMLLRALGERRIFDGWCIWSVVRYLAEKGGIHPAFLATIPLYVPPGATVDAPYGQAGYDCPVLQPAARNGAAHQFRVSPGQPLSGKSCKASASSCRPPATAAATWRRGTWALPRTGSSILNRSNSTTCRLRWPTAP